MNRFLFKLHKRLYGRVQVAVAISLVVGAFFGVFDGHEVGEWVPKLSGGVLAVCVWWGLFCFFVAEIHGFEPTKSVHPAMDWSAREVQVFSAWVVLVGSPLIALARYPELSMFVVGFGTGLFLLAWILRMWMAWVTAQQGSWFGYVSGTLGLPVSIGLFSIAYLRATQSLSCECGGPFLQSAVDSLGFLYLTMIFAALWNWSRIPLWARVLGVISCLQLTLTFGQLIFPYRIPSMWDFAWLSVLGAFAYLLAAIAARGHAIRKPLL